MTNAGRWAPWYADLPPDALPQAYGDSESYRFGAEWLEDCVTVQDWGCGLGWARQFYRPDQYVGIDGTASPFADHVTDLRNLVTSVEGIFMRGVIEHDYSWETVLYNAYASFTKRMCLVLFTPMFHPVQGDDGVTDYGPKQLAFVDEIGVPDLSFSFYNILKPAGPFNIRYLWHKIRSPNTGYGVETIFYLEKP